MKPLKALMVACVAFPGVCPWASAQNYNYIPNNPAPPYYPAPLFVPAQPIPLVPIPTFRPPSLLVTPAPTQPYYQGAQPDNSDGDD